jgi:hypothetical protein
VDELLPEFRFVLPLLPPAFVYAGYCLRSLERKLYVQFRERTQWNLLRIAAFSVIVPNVLSAYYLSRSHQVRRSLCEQTRCFKVLTHGASPARSR